MLVLCSDLLKAGSQGGPWGSIGMSFDKSFLADVLQTQTGCLTCRQRRKLGKSSSPDTPAITMAASALRGISSNARVRKRSEMMTTPLVNSVASPAVGSGQ